MAKKTTIRKPVDEARKLAIEAARIVKDSNCDDVVVLDLRGVSPITSYFVIGTGSSGRQMRGAADAVADFGRSVGQKPWHDSGLEGGQWIVMDFVDVVVHLFDADRRRYYDLELIWGEAPRVRWERRGRASDRPSAED